MNRNWLLLTGLTLLFCVYANAQTSWDLKLDKEGIRVYTRKLDNSPFRAVKTVCTINSSLTILTAVLLDIKGSAEWVYATKTISLLKQISVSELIYYSEIDVPWPAGNRDFIVQLIVAQDQKTKAVSVVGDNKPDYLPANKNIVRIQHSYSKWLITPLPNSQVKIEYVLEVDPGGNVPAWLVNLFATKGPFDTFKKLREQVRKPAYQHASLPFIKELNTP